MQNVGQRQVVGVRVVVVAEGLHPEPHAAHGSQTVGRPAMPTVAVSPHASVCGSSGSSGHATHGHSTASGTP